ncbi:MAG TPA: hypothetical protein VLV78_00545 [Thermoanaerobaculia bacterium]|nr:hypothetical protein [Thermoanaerobaculia bacterium]
MSTAVWVAATLLFTLFGVPFRDGDRASQLAIRFTTGMVIGGAVMWLEALLAIPWSRLALLIPLVVCGAAAVLGRRDSPREEGRRSTWPIALITLLAIYGVATARETSGDLLFFWGPKAQHFFLARTIDVGFLKFPHYYLMHPDYPPLQPLVYAWNSMAAHRFSYFGATFLTPLYLLATVLAFRGLARANGFATLLAALLAFGFGAGRVAGGADPQLILFEVVALAALTFRDDADLIAAIALAGAAFTKVEGASFAIILIVAFALTRRNLKRALLVAAPATVLLGSWIVFAQVHSLLDSYARGGTPLHFDSLGLVLYVAGFEASYRAAYLPWIAVLLPLPFGRNWGRAAMPLLVAAGSILSITFFYLHEPNAVWWIKASADRVLLTPLVALLVASAAASE